MESSEWLRQGEHKFPFEFVLPKDCPGSTPDLLPPDEKEYAYVGYRLKAVVKPSALGSGEGEGDIVVHRGLWLERCIHMSDIDATFQKPFVKTVSMDTGVINRGKVSCRLSLLKRVFVRGEQIPLTLEIDNQDKLDILDVRCRIKLKGHAMSSIEKHQLVKHFTLKGRKVKAEGVAAGKQEERQLTTWMRVSNADVHLLPVSHFQGSGLLQVNYFISVVLRRSSPHRNISFDIPIKAISHV